MYFANLLSTSNFQTQSCITSRSRRARNKNQPTQIGFDYIQSNISIRQKQHFIHNRQNPSKLDRSRLSPLQASQIGSEFADSRNHGRNLKSRLASSTTPLLGLFVFTMNPTICEIAGLAGFDFVVLDMEHGPGGFPAVLNCLHALGSTNTPAIIRIPEISPIWVMRALDLGPQGILFPGVENVEDAKLAVSYCRYPLDGIRGTAYMMVRQSAYGLDKEYLSHCEDLLIMCQVETVAGLEQVEAIAAVKGVDVIQTGPRDLAASMGYLSDPDYKDVREVLGKFEKEALNLKKRNGRPYMGGIASPHDPPEKLKARGYHMVIGGVDVAVFTKAMVEGVEKFRNAGNEDVKDDEQERKQKLGRK